MAKINEDQFNSGEEKRPAGGPSFRGTVLDTCPKSGGIDAQGIVDKMALTESNSKTKVTQALNNLYRDGKVDRRYVDGVSYYKQVEAPSKKEASA